MKRWTAADSIVAPLIAAVPPDVEWAGFSNALNAAVNGIPTPVSLHRVDHPKKLFKKIVIERQREVGNLFGEDAAPWTAGARCVESDVDGPSPCVAAICWEVGMRNFKDGLLTPAVPADWDSAALFVVKTRLSKDGLSGAPQLALLRHRGARSVQSASPEAMVFGGQHDWRAEWWNERQSNLGEVS